MLRGSRFSFLGRRGRRCQRIIETDYADCARIRSIRSQNLLTGTPPNRSLPDVDVTLADRGMVWTRLGAGGIIT